ncbi:MAG: zinc dependent phospholipase C family protein [Spirochaetes bacterium]|nr:zinc dependent phospholipase C family protein [Spirochaetota bacterium]
MPGIITHAIAFLESLEYLERKKHKSFTRRSIKALYQQEVHLRAGLFGALGPNIFDYNPFRKTKAYPGSKLSFLFHNRAAATIATNMLDRIIAMPDFNNEWASMQRAYFYGYLSHLICDAIFHPFVFFFSGFPQNIENSSKINATHKKQIIFFREQNLMFEYNIDAYFEHFYKNKQFRFTIDAFLPQKRFGIVKKIEPAIKEILLGAIEEAFPEKIVRLVWKYGKNSDVRLSDSFGFLDICPQLIKFAYAIKRAHPNSRIARFVRELRRRKLFYSDFMVLYPAPRKVNKHFVNLHRERWRNPSGSPGWRYESVEDLLMNTCSITTEIWEKVEGILFGEKKNYQQIIRHLSRNPFTGEIHIPYEQMKIHEAIHIRY